jgi:hypothetical protein
MCAAEPQQGHHGCRRVRAQDHILCCVCLLVLLVLLGRGLSGQAAVVPGAGKVAYRPRMHDCVQSLCAQAGPLLQGELQLVACMR